MSNIRVRIDHHTGRGEEFVGSFGVLEALGDGYARVRVNDITSVVCEPHWVTVVEQRGDEYPLQYEARKRGP